MATIHKNLSDHDPSQIPSGEGLHIAVVVSEWNREITQNLLQGAVETLLENGVDEDNITVRWVPGSFELPLGAQQMLEGTNIDAVICLGCVIRGETSHFEYVSNAVSQGVLQVGLKYNKPVVFGVLTDDHIDQSKARSGGKHGNKGVEAAVTALKMAR